MKSDTVKGLRAAYIDLVIDVLLFSFWDEAPRRIAETGLFPPKHLRRSRKIRQMTRNVLLRLLDLCASPLGASLHWKSGQSGKLIAEGKVWPSQAHSMIGKPRMENLRDAVRTVIEDDIKGDLIETGVWRGGSCILMRAMLEAYGDHKRIVHVADSFDGLPPPDIARYPADEGDTLHQHRELAISQQQVEDGFRRFGLLDDQVRFVKGFFEHTLHKLEADRFALIRLDGDMYGSTMQALEALYPKLSPGGFCIIDDFALPACKAAVDDYRLAHGIGEEIIRIDWTGAYWRKR
ncbi:MAG: TylF/MycF/NovP-related O-methyltransferase [Rhizobiaceae bacterium]